MTTDFLIEPQALPAAMAAGELLPVDARKPNQYPSAHIPGAVNLSTYDVFVPSTSEAGLAELRADPEWICRDRTPCRERRGRLPGAVHLERTKLGACRT